MTEQTRLNKGNINEHIDVGRRHFQGVLPLGKELEATNDCWEENSPLSGMSTLNVCSIQSGYPLNHIHTEKNCCINIFLHTYTCIHIYVCHNNNQKTEAINLRLGGVWKELEGRFLEWARGRKGMEKSSKLLFQWKILKYKM